MSFATLFESLTDNLPFPWQEALYERFVSGPSDDLSFRCDIPTGLGKTSVIAIWYLALAVRPGRMPRRLVYVVNRRTVVDQTTNEVIKIRDRVEKLREANPDFPFKSELAISTLRGQFADNRQWSADPTRAAVICGTVDMIGSRLLFSGYGIGYKQRPMHAGFLGQDALVIHDEAHLEQPFQELLTAIKKEQERCQEFGRFHVMELTATSRTDGSADGLDSDKTFCLTKEELNPPATLPAHSSKPIHYVWQRLKARKALRFHPVSRADLVAEIGKQALARKEQRAKVLIFVQKVADVEKLQGYLNEKKNGGVGDDRIILLTGTLRGLERDLLVETDNFKQFLDPMLTPSQTIYLICTSAGEVGVDISADHMLCDLTPLDSMAQRFGRVNRRGTGNAEVDVYYEADPDPKQQDSPFEMARWKTLEVLGRLPPTPASLNRLDSSPLALRNLSLSSKDREAAYTPSPQPLLTSDILFDAWSQTTIRGRLPGRPPVEPYLHGLAEWQPPETRVAWREDVERLTEDVLRDNGFNPSDPEGIGELFAEYPLKPHELLKDRSDRVFKELQAIATRAPNEPAWLMDDEDSIWIFTLAQLSDSRNKEQLEGKIVILPPSVGGLTPQGTLSGRSGFQEGVSYDVSDQWFAADKEKTPRRKRVPSDELNPSSEAPLRLIRELILRDDDEIEADATEDSDGSPPPRGPRFWRWYVRPDCADEDGSKTSAREPIPLDQHVEQVAKLTRNFAEVLGLDQDIRLAIGRAADFHDLGKSRSVWQRSIGNPNPDTPYAKSGGRWKPLEISKYRHELGSLVDILEQREVHLRDLSDEMQDLMLHLVAAHHGRGRPHFPIEEAFDPDPKGQDCEAIVLETALRFARLQKRYGRWGLAYLESLLRAADYEASANPTSSKTEDAQ